MALKHSQPLGRCYPAGPGEQQSRDLQPIPGRPSVVPALVDARNCAAPSRAALGETNDQHLEKGRKKKPPATRWTAASHKIVPLFFAAASPLPWKDWLLPWGCPVAPSLSPGTHVLGAGRARHHGPKVQGQQSRVVSRDMASTYGNES